MSPGINMGAILGIIFVIIIIGVAGMIFMNMSDTMLKVAEKQSDPSANTHPFHVNSTANFTGAPVYMTVTRAAYPGLFNDIQNNQNNFRVTRGTSGKTADVIPHYTEVVDTNNFRIWVNTDASTLNNTVISVNPLHYSTYDHSSAATFKNMMLTDTASIYHFSGNLQDTMGNFHGAAVDGATTASAAGRYGNYLSLNGTSQASNLGDLGTTYVNGVTVAAWVNTTDNGGYPSILSSIGYDAGVNFTTTLAGWDYYQLSGPATGAQDFRGAVFDGRYVYYVPYGAGSAARTLRYDTTGAFDAAGSWSLYDMTGTALGARDFYGAVFDGRYVYYMPYGAGSAARTLRYDTTQDIGLGLSSTMASNSFGAAPLAPTFAVGIDPTAGGLRMVSAPTNLTPNTWTHVAGTYDGQTVSLYVNGALAASRTYTTVEPAIQSTGDAYIGGSYNGSTWFSGGIDEAIIIPRALPASEIAILGTYPNYLDEVTLNIGDRQVPVSYDTLTMVDVDAQDTTMEHGHQPGSLYEGTEKYLGGLTSLTGTAANVLIIVMIALLILGGMYMWMNREQ